MRDGNHFSQHSGGSPRAYASIEEIYQRYLQNMYLEGCHIEIPLAWVFLSITSYHTVYLSHTFYTVSYPWVPLLNRTVHSNSVFSYGTNPNPYPYPFATIYIGTMLLVYITYPEDLPYRILKSHFFIPYRNGLSTNYVKHCSTHLPHRPISVTHTDPYPTQTSTFHHTTVAQHQPQ